MKLPRFLLADDHVLFLDGLRKLLESEFELVGAVSDGRSAVDAFQKLRPDLVLLDIGLPLLNGIETTRQIRRLDAQARILFVTMQADRIYVEEAFRAGGSGYVLKQAAGSELVTAIRTVLLGGIYLSPLIAERTGMHLDIGSAAQRFGYRLTPRQREVLQLVAEGKSMKDIAAILGISIRTVEFHKSGLMEELGMRTTAELTRYAVSQGITSA